MSKKRDRWNSLKIAFLAAFVVEAATMALSLLGITSNTDERLLVAGFFMLVLYSPEILWKALITLEVIARRIPFPRRDVVRDVLQRIVYGSGMIIFGYLVLRLGLQTGPLYPGDEAGAGLSVFLSLFGLIIAVTGFSVMFGSPFKAKPERQQREQLDILCTCRHPRHTHWTPDHRDGPCVLCGENCLKFEPAQSQ